MAKTIIPRDFYVYLHRKATTGEVFYVGKGQRYRATAKSGRNNHWHNIVNRHGLVVEYVIEGIQNWYAVELEMELIAYYGRKNLCNQTDGGEGVTGRPQTERARIALKNANVGRKASDEFREAMRKRNLGKKWGDDFCAKVSAALKGKIKTEEHKAKLRGQKRSDQTKAKLRAARIGKKLTPKQHQAIFANQMKRIECIELGQFFDSIESAATWVRQEKNPKAAASALSANCRGKVPSAYGFHWRYANAGVIS